MKTGLFYKHEDFAKAGVAFVHCHSKKGKMIEVVTRWRKIGNRYLANCSWCGCRVELLT